MNQFGNTDHKIENPWDVCYGTGAQKETWPEARASESTIKSLEPHSAEVGV